MRNRTIPLLCLLSALVIAGCGGGDGNYERQMQELQAQLASSAEEIASAFSEPSDLGAMTAGLEEAADLLDEASQSLDQIEPPEAVFAAHHVMVVRSAAAAETIRDFAATIKSAPLTELADRLAEFQNIEEFSELEAAEKEIQAAGYDIGGEGEAPSAGAAPPPSAAAPPPPPPSPPPAPPPPPPAIPDPAGRTTSNCSYVLGNFTETSAGYRLLADATVRNTGNVGVVARVTAKWSQAGTGPVQESRQVRVPYRRSRIVHITHVATQDEIDLHQASDSKCSVDTTIIDTFGAPR